MFAWIYPLLRFVLFRMDPEKSHDLSLKWLARIERSPFKFLISQKLIEDPVEVAGIRFPNRIGLAAGLDKNGRCIDAFAAMGFGHIEIGTVTPRPQPGNPKPRLFRLPKAQGLINRFGFNNDGVDQLIENVKASRFTGVLGINIGKNFDTPVENANQDYLICLQKVYPYASYIVVNISSPNTTNLRQLQFGEALEELILSLQKKQTELAEQYGRRIPIFIKIAPDLTQQETDELASTFSRLNVDGVIATNTTFSRKGVEGLPHNEEQGGLSGLPVLAGSNEVLARLSQQSSQQFPIIGVGGICHPEHARQKIDAGASLVQVYSGFIYHGPKLIENISKRLKSLFG
ncbi:MAG: quinone-dependent dihydroorotate dehydrogenase [Kangiellaceae bacterium]|jgi:dihydroorotate dehydrogenase